MSSIISCLFLLLLLLLCHAIHGCDGRHLGASKESHKHVHHDHSSKQQDIVEKMISKVKIMTSELPTRKHRKATNTDERVVLNGARSTTTAQKQIKHIPDHKADDLLNNKEETKQTINPAAGVVQIESLVTVSWRVPQKKHKEQPGSTTDHDEIISMFSDEGLQQSTKIDQGSERRGRSVLGISQSHVTDDETIDHHPKENVGHIGGGVSEDVVAMDYESPHKKPPIHNFSP